MSIVILTIQSMNNGNFRFHLSNNDFNKIIPHIEGEIILLNLPEIEQDVQAAYHTFTTYQNLVGPEISQWIINNNYHIENNGFPFRLIFKFENNIFAYYPNQAH